MIIRFTLLIVSIIVTLNSFGQDSLSKKVLTHDIYSSWKSITDKGISSDGSRIFYEVKPGVGDGFLVVYNLETGKSDTFPRAYGASFSPGGKYLAFLIKPQYQVVRQLQLKKTPKNKLPKDSLGIFLFGSDSVIKIAEVKKFSMPDSLSGWIMYESLKSKEDPKKSEEKKWWQVLAKENKEVKRNAKKQDGSRLRVLFPESGKSIEFEDVDEYKYTKSGEKIAIVKVLEIDTGFTSCVSIYEPGKDLKRCIFEQKGSLKNFNFDKEGNQWAFHFSTDTFTENKIFCLMYGYSISDSLKSLDSNLIITDTLSISDPLGYCPSENQMPYFSKDGKRIFFGIAPKPYQIPKDTLLDEEKFNVDVWNYREGRLQPQQLKSKSRDIKRTTLSYYDIEARKNIVLATPKIRTVRLNESLTSRWAIGLDDISFEREAQWDDNYYDIYKIDMTNGNRKLIVSHTSAYPIISPQGNHIIYFERESGNWILLNLETEVRQEISKNLGVNFFNEENDLPQLPEAYGFSGFSKDSSKFLINDRYDLWLCNLTGNAKPVNITKGFGRTNKLRFSVMTLNSKQKYFDTNSKIYLYAFDETNKKSGYYTLDFENGNLEKLILDDYNFSELTKAEEADIFYFDKTNVNTYPNIIYYKSNINDSKIITNINPEQSGFNWVTVERVKWIAFDGAEHEGLVYKPENFDSTKKYPLIVYFYEKYSDELHNFYSPKPSQSTINFTFYGSNGYIIFVPDVKYKNGQPGQSAYNSIVSGTEFMKKFKYIDPNKIGLQGQSWGGYQVAYLVTRTDIYACGEAGAAVSNMISAYGGIRWGAGISRQFQYEKGQSRIGVSPWDSLELYIQNSPIFYADKVNTPLLLMNNDNDGAVPWQQGIEYFTALRRLNKPVWMLNYNDDDHNIYKWPNRVDLSIRMNQFFDHYLKNQPMPEWMEEGIPATEKGKKNGYNLIIK